jgi:hypothetical protein
VDRMDRDERERVWNTMIAYGVSYLLYCECAPMLMVDICFEFVSKGR